MLFARKITVALLVAGFRMWRRLPPEDRRRVLNAVRRNGIRIASSLGERARSRTAR